jgi:hypothetical protein
MLSAVIETKEQYVNNEPLSDCPLCDFRRAISNFNYGFNHKYCSHYVFNNIRCYDWLEKNSNFNEFEDIFKSLHNKTIKQKCITRLAGWELKIKQEIKRKQK